MFGLTVPWAQELELSNNLIVVLFCISLITGDAEHLFMPVDYLLVFFFENCLFRSSVNFKTKLPTSSF